MRNSRPLSPHLGIYKLPLVAKLSIIHRVSSIFLFLFLLIEFSSFVIINIFNDYGNYSFIDYLSHANTSQFMFLFYIILIWTSLVHAFGGIRHLLMDIGYLMNPQSSARFGLLGLLSSTFLTLIIVYFIYI